MLGTSGKPLILIMQGSFHRSKHPSRHSSLFPGDGTVSFKDFLAVLTDSHRLAQCLRE